MLVGVRFGATFRQPQNTPWLLVKVLEGSEKGVHVHEDCRGRYAGAIRGLWTARFNWWTDCYWLAGDDQLTVPNHEAGMVDHGARAQTSFWKASRPS